MSKPATSDSARATLEKLLGVSLAESFAEEATGLARSVAEAARKAAAALPPEARDPTGFLGTLESLGPPEQKE
jgi:hypothetical protein